MNNTGLPLSVFQLFLLFHYVVSNIDVEPLLFHIEIVKPPHNAFVSSGWFSPFIVVDHLAFLDETTLSDYRFCYEIIIGEETNRDCAYEHEMTFFVLPERTDILQSWIEDREGQIVSTVAR